MSIIKFFIFSIFCVVIFSCKPGEDPIKKEALAIQDEAIHLGMDVEKMIGEVMVSDTTKENLMFTGLMKSKLVMWKREMIVIPGAKHDHSHDEDTPPNDSSDHTGHDHEGHDHLQADGNEVGAHLSSAELKDVQTEWKNQILSLQAELEKYKKEKGK